MTIIKIKISKEVLDETKKMFSEKISKRILIKSIKEVLKVKIDYMLRHWDETMSSKIKDIPKG